MDTRKSGWKPKRPLSIPVRYQPNRPNGKRVSGWENLNITALAYDMGVSYRFLLGVLTGQRNSTLAMLQHAARCLRVTLPSLVEQMEYACRLKLLEAATAPSKAERRRLRSEQRAIRSR